tara:strand:+ start:5518 stop:6723 length:1206 start_codon:yes stop_codon:yes gene_type:complete
MNFSFFIAKRYFLTNKKKNIVHIISWISLIGIAISTAALILVLSVFNGFEDLILKMYNSFDPHIKITSVEGKTFNSKNIILDHPDILVKSFVLEERVLLEYQQKKFIATIKGVSPSYKDLTNFDSLLVEGNYINDYDNKNITVVGKGVAYYLSIGLNNMFEQLEVFIPNRTKKTLLNPTTSFNKGSLLPVGVFSIQNEIDQEYIIVPLQFIQKLSKRENNISAIEIKLKNQNRMLDVQQELKNNLGSKFIIKNRLEQQEFLYKILNSEKLIVFLILVFIMIIAAFNIVGSLTMLILEKKKDIKTFQSFGATVKNVQSIFFNKSMLTIISGTLIGVLFGLILAFSQQKLGFISMGNGSFVVNAYPVLIKMTDVLITCITVLLIGFFASWYPSKILAKKLYYN